MGSLFQQFHSGEVERDVWPLHAQGKPYLQF